MIKKTELNLNSNFNKEEVLSRINRSERILFIRDSISKDLISFINIAYKKNKKLIGLKTKFLKFYYGFKIKAKKSFVLNKEIRNLIKKINYFSFILENNKNLLKDIKRIIFSIQIISEIKENRNNNFFELNLRLKSHQLDMLLPHIKKLKVNRIILTLQDCNSINRLERIIEECLINGIWIFIEDVPFCLATNFIEHIIEIYPSNKKDEFIKPPLCNSCIFLSYCRFIKVKNCIQHLLKPITSYNRIDDIQKAFKEMQK